MTSLNTAQGSQPEAWLPQHQHRNLEGWFRENDSLSALHKVTVESCDRAHEMSDFIFTTEGCGCQATSL